MTTTLLNSDVQASDTVTASEKDFFDSLVRDKGTFNPFSDAGWRTIEDRFVEFVSPNQKARILDIGCGTGESRKLYIDHVGEYTGVDLSEASVRFARQRFPQSRWETANACELPFADQSFEIVAFSSVLHHIDEYRVALTEAWRVLKPGGHAFAFDPNVLHPAMALFRKPESPFYISEGVSPNERPLQPRDLQRQFRAAGFAEVRQRCQSNIPYRAVAPRLMNSMLTAYNLVDRIWESTGFGRWFGTFAITVGTKPMASVSNELR